MRARRGTGENVDKIKWQCVSEWREVCRKTPDTKTFLSVTRCALHRIIGLSATPGQNKEKINEIIR